MVNEFKLNRVYRLRDDVYKDITTYYNDEEDTYEEVDEPEYQGIPLHYFKSFEDNEIKFKVKEVMSSTSSRSVITYKQVVKSFDINDDNIESDDISDYQGWILVPDEFNEVYSIKDLVNDINKMDSETK